MKEKITRFSKTLLICITFCLYPGIILSQESNPAAWNDFVYGKGNLIVQDTFKLQTFNKHPTDNWEYTISPNEILFDATLAGIKNSSTGMSLKLLPQTELIMEDYSPEIYQSIFINFPYAARQVMVGENLTLTADRVELVPLNHKLVEPKKEFSVDYRAKRDDINQYAWAQISNNPTNISLHVNTGKTSKNGYYAIDSIYAVGKIQLFTLFRGRGNWSDKTAWSHLPAARYRNALINGDIQTDQNENCHDLFIGNGSLHIQANTSLSINSLIICNPDIAIKSSGTLTIKDKITVHSTFPEKGKWYFISFPFNVYTSGVEASFRLGDKETKEDGNFFYIHTYNGDKRAASGSSMNNWEVVSVQSVNENNNLLFEKGKGYLIALDQKADKQTLSFAVESKDIPVDFGKNTFISIPVEDGTKEEHQGWFLCGNPLPAPLHLSEIIDNPALDGNIYVYSGTEYKPYSIGSDHVIPPFSAFFVRSRQSTQLEIKTSTTLRSSTFQPLPSQTSPITEPELRSPSSIDFIKGHSTFTYSIDGELLYLTDLPSSGKISFTDFTGRLVYSEAIPSGSTTVPIRLKAGTYILRIEANNHCTQHKFVWNK